MSDTIELERLMYIEDEPDIRLVAEIALAQVAGFNVKICKDGNEGLAFINDFKPQLVLLDVMMPGMARKYLIRLRRWTNLNKSLSFLLQPKRKRKK